MKLTAVKVVDKSHKKFELKADKLEKIVLYHGFTSYTSIHYIKLQSLQAVEFSTQLAFMLMSALSEQLDIRQVWNDISNSLHKELVFNSVRTAEERTESTCLPMLRSTTTRGIDADRKP